MADRPPRLEPHRREHCYFRVGYVPDSCIGILAKLALGFGQFGGFDLLWGDTPGCPPTAAQQQYERKRLMGRSSLRCHLRCDSRMALAEKVTGVSMF